MSSFLVANWAPRPVIASRTMIGRYVRIDPLNVEKDAPLLWDALGGNDGTLNERLKWYGLLDMKSPSDFEALVRSIEDKEESCVNVFRFIEYNQVVGMAAYLATDAAHGRTEVGYVGHGMAMARTRASTEAHYLLAKHAFEEYGYRRLEWKCDSNNEPSKAAALRYGYKYEGLFRQHRVTAKGYNRDTCWYSIIDSEWPECKAALEAWLDPSNFDESGTQKKTLESFRTPAK